MKLSPTISKHIRHLILNQGVARSSLFIIAVSTLLSVLIAKLVATLLPGIFGKFNIARAIIIPLLIAPPFSYIFMSLYFELEKLREEVHMLANTDELTKIYNRRYFFELAEREFERSRRNGSALAIILLDIDDFKPVNDSHGHLAGDFFLQEMCKACQVVVRPYDIFARFGGEEFIFLLPDTDEVRAKAFAERLRQLMAEQVVSFNGATLQRTISAGITIFKSSGDTLDDLISRADSALYHAKELGKNRVVVK